jgi:ketosteroid isomerase-like protein/phenylpyruvate tautomerase PptA (4-oxalocrotonate tautomerase family)
MPVIKVTLLPGYPPEVEQRLASRVAIAAQSVIAAPAAGTTVVVNHASTYRRDGRFIGAGAAHRPIASELALSFLGAMERRDLEAARQFLAPDFVMFFPGGFQMHGLEELVERSRGRYRTIAKDFERVDESWTEAGAVVYCSGRLHGIWNDGSNFSGIRFIDRFEIEDGLLRRQDVWNDMGLHLDDARRAGGENR